MRQARDNSTGFQQTPVMFPFSEKATNMGLPSNSPEINKMIAIFLFMEASGSRA